MKIKIEITRDKIKKNEDKNEDKKVNDNIISKHIKKMSLTKKLIYGGIATVIGASVMDSIIQQKETNTPIQYENKITATNNTPLLIIDPIQVEAKEVLKNYTKATTLEEQISVDALYKNQYLEITGKVSEIIDQDTISLVNENSDKWYSEWMDIECSFTNRPDLDIVQDLKEGIEVNVIGYCEGYDGLTVEMSKCTFR